MKSQKNGCVYVTGVTEWHKQSNKLGTKYNPFTTKPASYIFSQSLSLSLSIYLSNIYLSIYVDLYLSIHLSI